MSLSIRLPPPRAESCLETSRKSRYLGGTIIAEDVQDLAEHERRLLNPDLYRPVACLKCGARVHVHTRPERHPCGDGLLPAVIEVLQFRCASGVCRATWRVLPLFLPRHLWHVWKAVEQAVMPSASPAPHGLPIGASTKARWQARLGSSARTLVVLLALSGGVALENVAKRVGLLGTRGELVAAYAVEAVTAAGEWLSTLGALVHRLERGVRLM